MHSDEALLNDTLTRGSGDVRHPGFRAHLILREGWHDSKQRHPGVRAKAVGLVREHREECDTEWAAMRVNSARSRMSAETLRKWVLQAEIDGGEQDGVTTATVGENRDLKREVAELEQTFEILKAAMNVCARESDADNADLPLHRRAPRSFRNRSNMSHPD